MKVSREHLLSELHRHRVLEGRDPALIVLSHDTLSTLMLGVDPNSLLRIDPCTLDVSFDRVPCVIDSGTSGDDGFRFVRYARHQRPRT